MKNVDMEGSPRATVMLRVGNFMKDRAHQDTVPYILMQ